MALKLYYDHKLELLAKQFAVNVYAPAGSETSAAALLQGHTVVVQTRGMAEYLRQYLANTFSIAANLEMPFLNGFVNRTLSAVYGSEYQAAAQRSDPEYMRCQLMTILCDEIALRKDLPELANYAYGENSELKRWQIAGAIAGVFDHYQLYRSCDKINDMFSKASPENRWQQVLYCQLFNDTTPGRDHYFQRFALEELKPEQRSKLPREITVFGVGAMPFEYLRFFVALARYCQVNFFYLTPCMEYWENQRSRKEVKKPAAWEVAESGNPVLQNLGRWGRSFFSCMLNHDEIVNQMEFSFGGGADDYPPASTMLEILQYDIRYLFDRRKIAGNESDFFIGKVRSDLNKDSSIAIHNCHNLRRELEVLHDELLRLIKNGTDPGSIIVMAPDIAACAPVIHSVFGNGELANIYAIADMPQAEYAMALTTFKNIISTANSRFEYSAVMSLLDMPLINSILGFSTGELARFGDFIYQSGARWGFNDLMHEKFCSNRFEEFSWQTAVDRLLAGFANRTGTGAGTAITGNTKVMDALENSDMEAFARLVRILEKLAELSITLEGKKPIAEWCRVFEDILNSFFADNNSTRTAFAPLRSALRKLNSEAIKEFIPGKYPLHAALQILEDHINDSGENGRFLRGKITFCRLMPMRSIPMDTVAVIELNEGSFPRKKPTLGFDLLSLLPQPGDRSITAQDRYLLLEAVMAARQNLLFFYQGQDPRNGDELPPCAPLSEIMNYLAHAFELAEYKHKVSGISEVYFCTDAAHRSFNQENYRALKHLQNYLQTAQTQIPAAVAPGSAALKSLYTPWQITGDITIKELSDFFADPCAWFLKKRFDFSANQNGKIAVNDDELWSLSTFDRYNFNKLYMDMRSADKALEEIYLHASKSNLLPPGRAGRKEFDNTVKSLTDLPEFWQEAFKTMLRIPAHYRSLNKNYAISGMVNTSCDQKYVLVFNWSNYKSRHAIEALLGALTLSAAAAAENRSAAVGAKLLNLNSSNGFEFRIIHPLETAEAIAKLDELIALAGKEHYGPPPLFEQSSVYYQDARSAKEKFVKYDASAASVSCFFSKEMWDDADFSREFNYYATELYSSIEGDDENAGK